MKIGIISAYPPSKITLNEYGYYLVKNFAPLSEIKEIMVYCDHTVEEKTVDFDTLGKVKFRNAWKFNSLRNLYTLMMAIHKDKPDIVLINGQFMKFGDRKIAAAFGLLIGYFLRLSGIPSVFLIHNILEKVDLKKAGFTSQKWLAKIYEGIGYLLTKIVLSSNLVVVTIEEYVKTLQKKYGNSNIALIPHGTFEIPPLEEYKSFDEKVVMTFGKFGTYKKVEPLIEAVELLRKQKPNLRIKIVIAGTDNPNVKGYLDEVKSKYSHVPNIEFTGYVEEVDVPRIFKESTVVVFPYTSTTGSSGVLHQAGSYGKAAILPNIDDLSYLIEKEGYKGEYFEPENISQLAEAIDKIITDDKYRRSIEIANYQAATALPMSDICYWYLQHFKQILTQKDNSDFQSSPILKLKKKP